ncbi:MAG: hypothetical protein HZC02_04280 [Candidatus Levybacteria bacterium]|nr:hypothetical protein [Candidatus Levybacteria bacterium]
MRRALFLVPTSKNAWSSASECASAILGELGKNDSIRVITSSGNKEKATADRLIAFLCALSPRHAGLHAQCFNILGSDRCGSSTPETIMGQVDAFGEQIVVIVATEETIAKLYQYLCAGCGFAPESIENKKIITFSTSVLIS